ncbi:MAG: sensor histidine kinase [Maribacter sp.]|nr:sensor histidine kinase [Maribacter sp.]
MRHKFLIGIVILSGICIANAQTLMDLDSLLIEYKTAELDTSRVLLLINIGQQYEGNEPETAKKYYEEAGTLSKQLNYKRGTLKFISNYTYVLNMQGNYDTALNMNLESVKISRAMGDSLALAKCLFNTGSSYQLLNDYEDAISYYLEGKKIFSSLNNEIFTAQSSDILQVLYQKLKRYDKAFELGQEAIALSRKYDLDFQLGNALGNMAINYNARNQFDKALEVLNEALQISRRTDNKYLEVSVQLNFAETWEKKLQFDKMKEHAEIAKNLAVALGDVQSEGLALKLLSAYYLYTKELQKATELANQSYLLFQKNDLKREELAGLSWLGNIALVSGNVQEYLRYGEEGNLLADQLLNENIQKKIVELEKKYETTLKEEKIALLESRDLQQQTKLSNKSNLNIILISFIVVLFLLAFLIILNIRQKLIIRQKRISELEIGQQLMATEAVLLGEEKERVRVARDLHDGLGGLLSGIKFSFQNMKGNLDIPPENNEAFDKGMEMLDTSIDEIRRISHNMMPETLVKFGLDTALKDFCSNIDQGGNLQVTYQSIGMDDYDMEQSKAVSLYRIVQELVYNTVKHAQANTVIVQLIKNDENLSLTVEDDGIGFDPTLLEKNKGIGWYNIYSRVNLLKGKLDIHAAPGKGTSIHLTFNV